MKDSLKEMYEMGQRLMTIAKEAGYEEGDNEESMEEDSYTSSEKTNSEDGQKVNQALSFFK
jgi:hypothetical protein